MRLICELRTLNHIPLRTHWVSDPSCTPNGSIPSGTGSLPNACTGNLSEPLWPWTDVLAYSLVSHKGVPRSTVTRGGVSMDLPV